jgi:hypothetical protein
MLRPLRLGELFDQSFFLYRQHFGHFFGVALVGYGPLALIALGLCGVFESTSYWAWIVLLIGLPIFFWADGLTNAALTIAARDRRLGLTAAPWRAVFQQAWAHRHQLAQLQIIGWSPLALYFLSPFCLNFLSVFALGLLCYVLAILFPLYTPILIVETPPSKALRRRAWELARPRLWATAGFGLLFALMTVVMLVGPLFTLQSAIINGLSPWLADWLTPANLITLGSSLLLIAFMPFRAIAFLHLYFDLRLRAEGLDLVVKALRFTHPAQSETERWQAAQQAAPPAPLTAVITWREMVFFVALAVVALVVFVGLVVLIFFFADQGGT